MSIVLLGILAVGIIACLFRLILQQQSELKAKGETLDTALEALAKSAGEKADLLYKTSAYDLIMNDPNVQQVMNHYFTTGTANDGTVHIVGNANFLSDVRFKRYVQMPDGSTVSANLYGPYAIRPVAKLRIGNYEGFRVDDEGTLYRDYPINMIGDAAVDHERMYAHIKKFEAIPVYVAPEVSLVDAAKAELGIVNGIAPSGATQTVPANLAAMDHLPGVVRKEDGSYINRQTGSAVVVTAETRQAFSSNDGE